MYIQFSGPDQTSYETVAGSQIEWYQPPWEYGNILSYPGSYSQLQKIVPDINLLSPGPDGGALSWLTDGSSLTEKTAWTVGSGTSKSSSSENNYTFNNNTSVTAKGDAGVVTVGLNASLDLGGSTGFSNLTKSSTQLGKSTGIAIKKPPFPDPGSYGYWVTPFIYGNQKPGGLVDDQSLSTDVQTFGLLQTAFVVDPTRDNAGGWWKQTYTTAPDVALNHPSRRLIKTPGLSDPVPSNCLATGTGASQMNCVEPAPSQPANPWISEFHHMRGFFISKATHPGQGPQIETATAGDKLTLQARVYNYSLAQMDPTDRVHARFYGMIWNNANNKPVGDSFLIGEDVLPPIPPFNSDPSADLNWVYAKTDFDTTPYQDKYLVFWVVVWTQKSDATLAPEIASHGLTAIPGEAKSLADIQTEQYSNNVGFYKFPFYVFAPASAQATLIQQNAPGDVRIGSVKASSDTTQRGQAVEVSAQLRAWAKGVSGVNAVFYDGDPQSGGKAFDVERIPYIGARKAHEVRVSFRSNACGEHHLFVTIGRGKPYEVTGAPAALNVICEEPPSSQRIGGKSLLRGGRQIVAKPSAIGRREEQPGRTLRHPDEAAGGVSRRKLSVPMY